MSAGFPLMPPAVLAQYTCQQCGDVARAVAWSVTENGAAILVTCLSTECSLKALSKLPHAPLA